MCTSGHLLYSGYAPSKEVEVWPRFRRHNDCRRAILAPFGGELPLWDLSSNVQGAISFSSMFETY